MSERATTKTLQVVTDNLEQTFIAEDRWQATIEWDFITPSTSG
jgi:hypothetical protein